MHDKKSQLFKTTYPNVLRKDICIVYHIRQISLPSAIYVANKNS